MQTKAQGRRSATLPSLRGKERPSGPTVSKSVPKTDRRSLSEEKDQFSKAGQFKAQRKQEPSLSPPNQDGMVRAKSGVAPPELAEDAISETLAVPGGEQWLRETFGQVSVSDDLRLTSAEESERIENFVRFEGEGCVVSLNFLTAFEHLMSRGGAQEDAVCEELRSMQKGTVSLPALANFIEYQVYKEGEHLLTNDEKDWAGKIANELFEANINDCQKHGISAEDIEAEVLAHFMCEARYTEPVPGFVRKDRLGIGDTFLKVEPRADQSLMVIRTQNGMTVAYNNADFVDDQAALAHLGDQVEGAERIEFVPFDGTKFELVDMQVPVMSDALDLTFPSQKLDGEVLTIRTGKSPEEMGYRMTNESAGVFRRSFNSQRVIEVGGLATTPTGDQPATLQLKGAGVPEYGYGMGDFTGGEFFKLTAEKGAMGLYDFAGDLFEAHNVTPNMMGMALVSNTDQAFSGGTRQGAVSMRVDSACGIRAANVLEDGPMRARAAGVKDWGRWRDDFASKVVHHQAIANLFGMYYDDSSLKDFADFGLDGQFSDSGTLRNLGPVGAGNAFDMDQSTFAFALNKNLRVGVDEVQQLYCDSMDKLLNTVANHPDLDKGTAASLSRLANDIKQAYPNPRDRHALFMRFGRRIGGKTSETLEIQKAFNRGGAKEYAKVLATALEDTLDDRLLSDDEICDFVLGALPPEDAETIRAYFALFPSDNMRQWLERHVEGVPTSISEQAKAEVVPKEPKADSKAGAVSYTQDLAHLRAQVQAERADEIPERHQVIIQGLLFSEDPDLNAYGDHVQDNRLLLAPYLDQAYEVLKDSGDPELWKTVMQGMYVLATMDSLSAQPDLEYLADWGTFLTDRFADEPKLVYEWLEWAVKGTDGIIVESEQERYIAIAEKLAEGFAEPD